MGIRFDSPIYDFLSVGDSNLATFRNMFYQIHAKRQSLSSDFEVTLRETQTVYFIFRFFTHHPQTLEQLHQSMESSISAKLKVPKSKYLAGTQPQQKQPTKTGSGIRAVNMKAKKVKDSLLQPDGPQLTDIFSFSDSLDFALDISYFLSILTAVSESYFSRYRFLFQQNYLIRGEFLSEIGQVYLKCLALLHELVRLFSFFFP